MKMMLAATACKGLLSEAGPFIYPFIYLSIFLSTHVSVSLHMYIHIYTYTHRIYVCIHIYIYAYTFHRRCSQDTAPTDHPLEDPSIHDPTVPEVKHAGGALTEPAALNIR